MAGAVWTTILLPGAKAFTAMTWVESSVATVCVVMMVVSRVMRVCANANGAMNAQLRMTAIVSLR